MSQVTFVEVPIEAYGVDLGLAFVLVSDGRIVLETNPMFVPTYDYSKTGVTACFDYEGFALMEPEGDFEGFHYGTPYRYKEIPAMHKWLAQQNFQPI